MFYLCLNLSGSLLPSLVVTPSRCSLLPLLPPPLPPPLSPPAGPFLSVIIGFQKAGRGHTSHLPSSPLPSFTLILSFIFPLFNNSLSALWPLIKMNSLCCRLLPSSLSLSLSLSLSPSLSPSSPFPFHFTDPLPKNLTLLLPSRSPSSLHSPWYPLSPAPPPSSSSSSSSSSCLPSFSPLTSPFFFNFSPPDTTVHHVPGSGHRPPSDAHIHQDFEKQKSLSPLLRWPLPLIALSITPGGWSIPTPFPSSSSLPPSLPSPAPSSPPSSVTLHCISFTSGSLQQVLCGETEPVSPLKVAQLHLKRGTRPEWNVDGDRLSPPTPTCNSSRTNNVFLGEYALYVKLCLSTVTGG